MLKCICPQDLIVTHFLDFAGRQHRGAIVTRSFGVPDTTRYRAYIFLLHIDTYRFAVVRTRRAIDDHEFIIVRASYTQEFVCSHHKRTDVQRSTIFIRYP
ncbi:hypothetical protein D9M68_583580 [compost metagenome]